MAFPRITKGGDELIRLTLQDADGTAIVINSLYDLIIRAYQNKNFIVQEWSKLNDSVTVVDSANGIVTFILDRMNTDNLLTRRLYLEIDAVTADANYSGGYKHELISDVPLTDLIDGV